MIRWSAHLAMLFREADPLDRPAVARAAGFSAVESWWPANSEAWAAAVAAAGVQAVLVNAFAGDIAGGDRGFATDRDRHMEVLEHVTAAIALAVRVRCPHVNVLAGKTTARGQDADLDAVVALLSRAARAAEDAGVVLVLEPLNRLDNPDYAVPDATSAVAILERVGSPAVRLLYDTFHAARSGHDPGVEVRALAPWIAHVQYADSPGRGAPGTGGNDLSGLLEALTTAGYAGAIGLEFHPDGATLPALAALPHRPDLVTPLS